MNNKEIMKRLQECVDSEAKTIDGCTKLTEYTRNQSGRALPIINRRISQVPQLEPRKTRH